MKKNNPKISIITVVYNNVSHIEQTIVSVLDQTYKDIEYIIIDGGSTDGTVNIIKRHHDDIAYWISESDRGIYDAMNKGIKKARGEYVYFLNSGDTLIDKNVLSHVSKELSFGTDYLFGRAKKIHKKYFIWLTTSMNKLKYGKAPCHQATFVKKTVLEKINYFDIMYQSAADLDMFCRLYFGGYTYFESSILISEFLAGGFSSNKKISYSETVKIIKKYFGFFYGNLFYLKKIYIEQGVKKLSIFLGIYPMMQSMQRYLVRKFSRKIIKKYIVRLKESLWTTKMSFDRGPFNEDVFMEKYFLEFRDTYDIHEVIETGTYHGMTTEWFARYFSKVQTIEINDENFTIAKNRLSRYSNVTLHKGSSADILGEILRGGVFLDNGKHLLIFLDAHWHTNPVLQELHAIKLSGLTPVLAIHDFKNPLRPEYGYDSYSDQGVVYEWDWIKNNIEEIYKTCEYKVSYNLEAEGARRGCLFITPIIGNIYE
jgi:glycosyltransferase involved in cell wall biosynthesis